MKKSIDPTAVIAGLILILTLSLAASQVFNHQLPDAKSGAGKRLRTYSSFDQSASSDRLFAAKTIKFEEANLSQVLALYAEISGRSVICAGDLPDVKITFSNQRDMRLVEVLRTLDTVLAAQGIAIIYQGMEHFKVVRDKDAIKESGPLIEIPPDQLPDSSTFLIYVVTLKRVTHIEAGFAVIPYSRGAGSCIGINYRGEDKEATRNFVKENHPQFLFLVDAREDKSFLILRDYASNVRRMLQALDELEKQWP